MKRKREADNEDRKLPRTRFHDFPSTPQSLYICLCLDAPSSGSGSVNLPIALQTVIDLDINTTILAPISVVSPLSAPPQHRALTRNPIAARRFWVCRQTRCADEWEEME
jgi:hypothetical protein